MYNADSEHVIFISQEPLSKRKEKYSPIRPDSVTDIHGEWSFSRKGVFLFPSSLCFLSCCRDVYYRQERCLLTALRTSLHHITAPPFLFLSSSLDCPTIYIYIYISHQSVCISLSKVRTLFGQNDSCLSLTYYYIMIQEFRFYSKCSLIEKVGVFFGIGSQIHSIYYRSISVEKPVAGNKIILNMEVHSCSSVSGEFKEVQGKVHNFNQKKLRGVFIC